MPKFDIFLSAKKTLPLIKHFFFPVKCHYCLEDQKADYIRPLCETCSAKLSFIEKPYCLKCSLPNPDGVICRNCREKEYFFDFSRSVFRFEPRIRELIHDYKYRGFHSLSDWFAVYMANYAGQIGDFDEFDFIVGVPISRRKKLQRGYNQSELLAEKFSLKIRKPYKKDFLLKIKNTSNQAELSAKERVLNVRGAFSLKDKFSALEKNILIVDDVATTLSTLNECAKVLKEGGAKKVACFTLAKE